MNFNNSITKTWAKFRNEAPGLVSAFAVACGAILLSSKIGALSPLLVSLVAGIAFGNSRIQANRLRPGLTRAAKTLLRLGIVLLGFRLVAADILELGLPMILLVVTISAITFVGIYILSRRLALSRDLGLLIGTGFAICGASAIAAAQGVIRASKEDVAAALGNVMLFGTLSIGVMPLLASVLGLPDPLAGAWIGASVHDVGQTVAAADSISPAALNTAVIVKLMRVLLLAPLILFLTVLARRKHQFVDGDKTRPPLIPLFVLGFLLAATLRTLNVVPPLALQILGASESLIFSAALFGLGVEVRASRLRTLGIRPLIIGASAWLLIATTSLIGVKLFLPT